MSALFASKMSAATSSAVTLPSAELVTKDEFDNGSPAIRFRGDVVQSGKYTKKAVARTPAGKFIALVMDSVHYYVLTEGRSSHTETGTLTKFVNGLPAFGPDKKLYLCGSFGAAHVDPDCTGGSSGHTGHFPIVIDRSTGAAAYLLRSLP